MKPQIERQAASRGAVRVAGCHVRIDAVGTLLEQMKAVVVAANTEVNAGSATGKLRVRLTGIFERLPGDLHGQAMLRIETLGFARSDTEKVGVEVANLADEASEARRDLAGHFR